MEFNANTPELNLFHLISALQQLASLEGGITPTKWQLHLSTATIKGASVDISFNIKAPSRLPNQPHDVMPVLELVKLLCPKRKD